MTVSWGVREEREPGFIDVPQEKREGQQRSDRHQPSPVLTRPE